MVFRLTIDMVLLDERCHFGVEVTAGAFAFGYELAHKGAAHVIESGLYEAYVRRQRGLVNGVTVARINHDRVVGKYITAVAPTAEELPVVGSDNQREAVLRIVFAEMLQRVPRV